MSIALPILSAPEAAPRKRLAPWLKKPLPSSVAVSQTRQLLDGLELETVCSEARCPNLNECWSKGTATFMILGARCTRRCHYCAVTTAPPEPVKTDEPDRLAEAAARMGLMHVVITSVARDDLRDGGALHFSRCIEAVHKRLPQSIIEVLTPDFQGNRKAIETVCDANPHIFNHNIETVERLQRAVRPAARYERSLSVLSHINQYRPQIVTKSGMMLGLGERPEEIKQTLADLRHHHCQILTLGQYLQPGDIHVPVQRFVSPEEFDHCGNLARQMGFASVASGPFVRSSYNAKEVYEQLSHV